LKPPTARTALARAVAAILPAGSSESAPGTKPPRLSLRVLRCPPGGRCACSPAKPVPQPLLVKMLTPRSPHLPVLPEPVEGCSPQNSLQPGKANPSAHAAAAAPAGEESQAARFAFQPEAVLTLPATSAASTRFAHARSCAGSASRLSARRWLCQPPETIHGRCGPPLHGPAPKCAPFPGLWAG